MQWSNGGDWCRHPHHRATLEKRDGEGKCKIFSQILFHNIFFGFTHLYNLLCFNWISEFNKLAIFVSNLDWDGKVLILSGGFQFVKMGREGQN